MGLSHAAIVGAHPDVDMVAVCDTSSLVLDAFKKFTGVKTYTDFQKMITAETPDFACHIDPYKISLSNGKVRYGERRSCFL